MNTTTTTIITIKRVVRVMTSRLPILTKIDVLRATWQARRSEREPTTDLDVRLGAVTITLAALTFQIDYRTMYGLLIDRQFASDFDGADVVDIGAHKGYYAAMAIAGGARSVESYEPASQNHGYLARSARATTSDTNWITHRSAIGPTRGRTTLNLSENSWGHSLATPVDGVSVGAETVDVTSLHDALSDASAQHNGSPLVVKINIEGLAGTVLVATDPETLSAVDDLFVDIEPTDPVPSDALDAHLAVAGLVRTEHTGTLARFRRGKF